jgi:hypothetical protein
MKSGKKANRANVDTMEVARGDVSLSKKLDIMTTWQMEE